MLDVLTSKRIHIIVPVGLLADIDQRALAEALSRSDYIRIALMEHMGRQNMLDFPPSRRGTSMPEIASPEYADDPESFFWPEDDAYDSSAFSAAAPRGLVQ